MKKISWCMLLGLLAMQAPAQRMRSDTVAGYVVTLGHDTVLGNFQLILSGRTYNSETWYKRALFIDSTGQLHKYEPTDILAFGFSLDTLRDYIFRAYTVEIPNQAGFFKGELCRFLMVEADGPVCLMRYYHAEVSLGFNAWYNERYLQRGAEAPQLLKRNNQTQKYRLGDKQEWFSDYPAAKELVDKELDAKELGELVLTYNEWKKAQH